ncbi:tetratricopeptide repeat-containing sensor histidine kinase [Xanthocytophaga agilis]|uniref:histidine kinase n=1 Tax=Xanthocytophaga agilis TaxID=3048010 RepID=A0AAE3RAL4_9BACT|nr:tetratricopeptide repeat-containing sensor histidine kinase [Xanthocytophaga agilis]MDJ1506729.1 tetratricopeptide repeat-containing sensor histidine kinase [Xanthocytophaga agilis]
MTKLIKFLIIYLIACLVSAQSKAQGEDTLEAHLQKLPDVEKVNFLNHLAEVYSVRIPLQALKYGQLALTHAQTANYIQGQAKAFNNIGEYYLNNGEYDKANEQFQQALKIGYTISETEIIATSLTKIGVVYYFKGDYQKALHYLHQTLPLHKKLYNLRAIANTQNTISYIYANQGVPEKALEYALQSLRIRKELNDPNEIAKSLNSLGDFYYNQSSLRKALHNYLESLRISRQTGNQRGIAFALDNIGKVYLRQDRFQESLLYFREALTISEQLNSAKQTATTYIHMGNTYQGLHDKAKAYRYYTAALRVHYNLKNDLEMVPILNQIGKFNALNGDFKTALSFHYQALSKVKNSQSRLLKRDTYKALADSYLQMKNANSFMEYYQLYSQLQDSIQNDASLRKIAELQTRFELEENQQHIEHENELKNLEIERQKTVQNYLIAIILAGTFLIITLIAFYISHLRANRQLKVQNETIIHKNRQLRKVNEALKTLNDKLIVSEAELRKTNETKDKFFSIIAHDLRAPLATFSSFLTALSDADDSFTQEDIEFITKSTQKSLKNLTDLLNNLLQWSRSQMGSIQFNPQSIILQELIQQTVSLVTEETANKSISIVSKINPEAIAFADANMLDFVIRNIVSNAVKFTPRGGNITIESFDVQDNKLLGVRIIDTGVGISPDNLKKLFDLQIGFTTIGTANEKGTGLGLVLCKEFVEKNGGKIFVESEPGKGTQFSITIPKNTARLSVN